MNEREATKSRKGEGRRKKEREANYGKPTFISVTWNVRFHEFSRSTFAIVSRLNTEPYVFDWSNIERYRRENIEFQRITSFLNCNSGEGTSAQRSVCIVPPEARYARNLADDIDGERGGGDGCYLNYSIFSRDPCNGFFFSIVWNVDIESRWVFRLFHRHGLFFFFHVHPFFFFSFLLPSILLFLSLVLHMMHLPPPPTLGK